MVPRAAGRAVAIVVAVAATSIVAVGQPVPDKADRAQPEGKSEADAKPAGSSSVESIDVPVWQPSPPRFAVTPFENHSNVKSLDWVITGAPFEISEKTEGVLGLEPTGGPLHVGGVAVPPDPASIAEFARSRDASYVVTGWFDRPNWELRLDILVWKIDKGVAVVAGESQRQGPPATYHRLLGEAMGEAWTKAGVAFDLVKAGRLQRALAIDVYAVNLMGRGLGHLNTALLMKIPPPAPRNAPGYLATAADRAINQAQMAKAAELAAAQHDLERSVFIDPKCYEAQRLIGELYLVLDQRARATAKFNYAVDLAPDDIAALRAAASATAAANKHELAEEMYRKLVTYRPWDLDARYQYGAALWHTGDAGAAEKQLEQVTQHAPDDLRARRVLALIHASRSDTKRLVDELEAIAKRAPDDLEVKADLATAYGALGEWDRSAAALEAIAVVHPNDLSLAVRIGDAHRKQKDLDGALGWYMRAARLQDTSYPGFIAAQAQFDAGRYPEAIKAYTSLQRFREDLPAAEQALGVIAILQNRYDDAAWYLRRATRSAPRSLPTWQALAASEVGRKDHAQARRVIDRAREVWPVDPELRYLSGLTHALAGETAEARIDFAELAPSHANARSALAALDTGRAVPLAFSPVVARPWTDAEGFQRALDAFEVASTSMIIARASYQTQILLMLGEVGQGPLSRVKPQSVRSCPLSRMATFWSIARAALDRYERLGIDLERTERFIVRHDEIGATAGLLPNARSQVARSKKSYRVALADISELRAEWSRLVGQELRSIGCNEKLLAAAVADPSRYHIIEEDKPDVLPTTAPPRAKPRATFYVNNNECSEDVEVWIDGTQLGHVAPGRTSALVSDGGERALCLIVAGNGQCGDRGTVRQVYLHDGWSVTLHCPK